jgi:uncharacterized protein
LPFALSNTSTRKRRPNPRDPGLTMPVMLGVLAGSMIGARVLMKTRADSLRVLFSVVILALAIEMIYSGLTGRI